MLAHGEDLPFEDEEFDLVISYLSLLDIPDWRRAISEMCRVLGPDGRLFLVTMSNMASTSMGWIKDAEGRKLHRPVDRYMEDFAMDLEWDGMRIVNYHRPLSAILNEFFRNGVVMNGFHEPLPPSSNPWYADELRRPTFQIYQFIK